MTAVLFLGPSLPGLHRRPPARIELRPPAAQGDLLRAVHAGRRLIGLVDGVFGHEPAVWHKEILAALEAGARVFGAASMGALRAAELNAFGMEGVGTIFAAYRDGLLEADDEVALLHGPAELGWPALSEPMVNLRATLARLARLGVVGQGEAERVARLLAARFYPERTRAALEDALRAEVGPARAETVVRWARRRAGTLIDVGDEPPGAPAVGFPLLAELPAQQFLFVPNTPGEQADRKQRQRRRNPGAEYEPHAHGKDDQPQIHRVSEPAVRSPCDQLVPLLYGHFRAVLLTQRQKGPVDPPQTRQVHRHSRVVQPLSAGDHRPVVPIAVGGDDKGCQPDQPRNDGHDALPGDELASFAPAPARFIGKGQQEIPQASDQ